MNTPKTDEYALDAQVTVASMEKGIHLMRQLETELAEMREALEMLNNEFKRLPHSLGYRYTHTEKVDAILERTK